MNFSNTEQYLDLAHDCSVIIACILFILNSKKFNIRGKNNYTGFLIYFSIIINGLILTWLLYYWNFFAFIVVSVVFIILFFTIRSRLIVREFRFSYTINRKDAKYLLKLQKFIKKPFLNVKNTDFSNFIREDFGIKIENKKIISVGLQNCNLKTLPKSLLKLENIRSVDLSRNDIKLIPESISRLTNLGNLDLSFNKLKVLPLTFGDLHKLTYLDLTYNRFRKFPTPVTKLKSLTKLILNSNKINTISNSIRNMDSLFDLYMDNNRLCELPRSLLLAPNLRFVQISDNLISINNDYKSKEVFKEFELRNITLL